MSASGYTPILIYASGTATNVPLAANMTSSASGAELALNYADGKLFYKDSGGVVQVLASKAGNVNVASFSAGTTGFTPSSATTGVVTLAGTLATTNGGTGLTSFTANQVFYASSTSAFAQSTNLQFSGTDLTVYGITVGRGAGAVSTNTAVGASALTANTTGANNTAVGYQAGYSNTTGTQNVAVGGGSFYSSTSANFNTGLGFQAGYFQTGVSNTAIGLNALYGASGTSTGVSNVAVGFLTLTANTSGNYNTALGTQALYANTTASNNTAVGYQAGYSNTTGYVTAVGYQALQANTTGNGDAFGSGSLLSQTTAGANVGLGFQTLRSTTTGSGNTASGYQAMVLNTTGGSNVANGYQALFSNTTASNNTAVGYQAGYALTSNFNVCVGYLTGSLISSGIGNTIIGGLAGQYGGATGPTTGSYNTLIGYGTRTGTTDTGSIVIGAPGSDNAVTGKGTSTGFISPNGGGVYQGNNSSTWSVTSDQRLKKNIVDNNIGLSVINQIQVRNFEYRLPDEITEVPQDQAIEKQGVQLGVIAQELQSVLPECVKTESTGVMTVDTDNLTWYMINAIKELKAEIDSLKSQLKGA